MKQIHFFAVKEDLLHVLEAVEHDYPLKYIRMDHYSANDFESFQRGSEIPNLGNANTDTASSCEAYLVVACAAAVRMRPIDTDSGDRIYSVDQLLNPDSIVFTPGGISGEEVVLNGRLGTASESDTARELMNRFGSTIRRRFSKVKAFFVGPKAMDLLRAGKRFTASVQSPREYDLAL